MSERNIDDEYWMQFAYEQAALAAADGEIPVGAVIVSDGKIIGAGGGGLFMFYVNNDDSKKNIRKEFSASGMNEIKLPFEEKGSNIILNLLHGSQ